jgi:hypothetical protein
MVSNVNIQYQILIVELTHVITEFSLNTGLCAVQQMTLLLHEEQRCHCGVMLSLLLKENSIHTCGLHVVCFSHLYGPENE